MFQRAGQLVRIGDPKGDLTWSSEDKGRSRTLEARYRSLGVSEEELGRLLPCAVLQRKTPGLRYPAEIEKRLVELACKN